MSKTRNNHYVPQWYQEGFFEIGRSTLAYLDMKPAPRDYAMHKSSPPSGHSRPGPKAVKTSLRITISLSPK
jgi:hypothetical protein